MRTVLGTAVITAVLTLTHFHESAAQTTQSSAGSIDPLVLEDLVIANHILADQNILDGFGHVSIRHPTNSDHYLMSRSIAPALAAPDDIIEYDLNSNPLNAKDRVSFLERFIHGEIYKLRPDVKAVVHTHSSGVIPFSTSQVPLKPIMHTAAFLSPAAPVFEIRNAGGITNMLVGNAQLGKALAETLGTHNVALMRGHGDVVVASSLQMAVFRAYYTDVNARLEAQAIVLGTPVTFLEPEESEKLGPVLEQIHTRAWDLWKRAATRKMPSK